LTSERAFHRLCFGRVLFKNRGADRSQGGSFKEGEVGAQCSDTFQDRLR
jgi:hypothetical protein